jgi:hypothetical protein
MARPLVDHPQERRFDSLRDRWRESVYLPRSALGPDDPAGADEWPTLRRPPLLGEHTAEMAHDILGLSDDEISRLPARERRRPGMSEGGSVGPGIRVERDNAVAWLIIIDRPERANSIDRGRASHSRRDSRGPRCGSRGPRGGNHRGGQELLRGHGPEGGLARGAASPDGRPAAAHRLVGRGNDKAGHFAAVNGPAADVDSSSPSPRTCALRQRPRRSASRRSESEACRAAAGPKEVRRDIWSQLRSYIIEESQRALDAVP